MTNGDAAKLVFEANPIIFKDGEGRYYIIRDYQGGHLTDLATLSGAAPSHNDGEAK